jgi:signal transduction histidine kinase
MSHELRTPLNAIIGFSEMLTAGFPGQLNPKQHGYVANIHEGGGFLLRVINDVLDLAQVDAGKLQLHEEKDIELDRIAAACIALVEEQAAVGGLRLSLEIEERIPRVVADSTRLSQILLNLLSNAVKFTEPGGSVTLAIRRTENGGVVFEVRDTGPGLTAAEIEIALQPFGQVEGGLARRHNGTGLGLPLARELAELHGGSLDIVSEKGRGTTVTVTLPAARVLADPAPPVGVGQAA